MDDDRAFCPSLPVIKPYGHARRAAIELGDFIGDFVAIYDTNHHSMDGAHPARSAPAIIGTNVWLGHHVTVLPGSKIADHTVVSAGSVVRGDLSPRVLAVGNPATPVKDLEIPDGWRRT